METEEIESCRKEDIINHHTTKLVLQMRHSPRQKTEVFANKSVALQIQQNMKTYLKYKGI